MCGTARQVQRDRAVSSTSSCRRSEKHSHSPNSSSFEKVGRVSLTNMNTPEEEFTLLDSNHTEAKRMPTSQCFVIMTIPHKEEELYNDIFVAAKPKRLRLRPASHCDYCFFFISSTAYTFMSKFVLYFLNFLWRIFPRVTISC